MGLYRAKEVWTGTLASSIPDGTVTSFTLTSSSGLTNGETYVFTIDRVDANGTKTPRKKEVIVGTVSGSNVINCQRGAEGTAQDHSAGAVVEILFTAKHWNDLIDSYKTQHNSDGTHSKIQGLDNNQAITQKDSSGTARSIAKVNSSNVLEIGDTNLAGIKLNIPSLAQGDILYVDSNLKLTRLPAGTSGYYLKTNGASANPEWASVSVSSDGWIAANETWTYSSWDASVYTGVITVPSDATTKYSAGMRIKITQTTGGTKYGIITAVATTSLTVFFGTDYTLTNEAISNPYYSPHKAPLGFPLDPNKWKIEVTDTTTRSKTSPTQNTIYYTDFGSININVPIGCFRLTLSCLAGATVSANNYLSGYLALSTSTSSISDLDLRVRYARSNNNLAYTQEEDNPVFLEKTLNLSSKTTYYLILWTDWSTTGELSLQNSSQKLILRAICAYL